MNDLFNELKDLLIQDDRFMADDDILKNRLTEFALKLDIPLLKLLLSHLRFKDHFFMDVDGIMVFDQPKFIRFVNNKAFLPNSYTSFKNKIGLTINDDYLQERREVALVWPYKDCVLQGGQSKEDAGRNEIFWNGILAPDEIDRLFDPKALTGFKRYDVDGEHPVTEIGNTDNLIIKGNNLLALHSLKKRFAGKVKLIYIDPPYNTGNDGFNYNDRFNHSTWLTFMKNRLEIARNLLSSKGVIFIQITDQEQAYLKILLDEIFGRENFIETIIWKKRNGPPNDKIIGAVHEYILIYAKDFNSVELFLRPRTKEQLNRYSNPDNHPKGLWASGDLMANVKGGRYVKSLYYPIVNPNTGEEHYPSSGGNWRFNQAEMQRLIDNDEIYWGEDGERRPKLKRFLADVREGVSFATIWAEGIYSHTGTNEIRALFDKTNIFDTPKPEALIQRVLQLGSEPGDLVLDFFAGSGTTAAVAHKMGRQFITVEQMDYTPTITVQRLIKVVGQKIRAEGKLFEEIDFDRGGVSKEVEWSGGGSFIYCELMQWNQQYVDRIETAAAKDELQTIWLEMQEKAFLSYRLDIAQFNQHAATFAELSLTDQKKFLLEVLDKNQLYVNLSEADDETYGVSTADKTLNRRFYGLE